jgi:hypothetical protein
LDSGAAYEDKIMSLKLEYIASKHILIGTFDGELTIEMVQSAFKEIVSSSEYPPDISTIWDIRKLDLTSVDRQLMDKIIYFRQGINSIRGAAKIALVADSELSFGLGRMYEGLSGSLAQEMSIFKSMEEAEKWLAS